MAADPFAAAYYASGITGRLEQSKEALQLLETGKDDAKQILLAKKCAQDGAALEKNLLDMLDSGSAIYEEAAQAVPAAVQLEAAGIQWSNADRSFESVSRIRAKLFEEVKKLIVEPVQLPTLSPAESDAQMMVVAEAGVLSLPGAQAAKDRIDIGRAGGKLLQDGGENVVPMLIAKQLGKDAAARDARIVEAVKIIQRLYEESCNGLTDLALEGTEGLAEAYDVRLKAFKEIEAKLGIPTSAPEFTHVEEDALKIQDIKAQCATARVQATTALESCSQAAQDRLNQAKAGKDLLDKGGENAVNVVIAKKIARDASSNDKDIATKQVEAAATVFLDAAAAIKSIPSADGVSPVTNADTLAKAYEEKAAVYKSVQEMLAGNGLSPVEALQLTPIERDAVRVVQLNNSYAWARVHLERSSLLKGILLQGNLKKRGPMLDFAWEDRYCTLSHKKMSYYTEATCSELKGEIELVRESRVYALKNSGAPGDSAKHSTERPHGFVVDPEPSSGKDRQLFYFDAENADKLQMWLNTIATTLGITPN